MAPAQPSHIPIPYLNLPDYLTLFVHAFLPVCLALVVSGIDVPNVCSLDTYDIGHQQTVVLLLLFLHKLPARYLYVTRH